MKPRLAPRVFHPILFALFPVLSLYAHNIVAVPLFAIVRPAIVVLAGVLLLWAVAGVALRDANRAAPSVSLLVFLFFAFMHVFVPLHASTGVAGAVGRFRVFVPLWMLLFGLGVFIVQRSRRHLHVINAVFNVFGLTAVTLCLLTAAANRLRYFQALSSSQNGPPVPFVADGNAVAGAGTARPDVYYIIFDMYAGEAALRRFGHYDNRPFLNQLANRGFYVAHQSRTNYPVTDLSLASSLNMTYLDGLARTVGAGFDPWGEAGRGPVNTMLNDNAVVRAFRRLGYRCYFVETGGMRLSGAVTITPGLSTSEFEDLLIGTTPIALWDHVQHFSYAQHRQRLLFAFDQLGSRMPRLDSPKLVVAHILAPHPPFVFGPRGEPIVPEQAFTMSREASQGKSREELKGNSETALYVGQLQGINPKVLAMIDGIRANSARPPVIIVQGDHSFGAVPDIEYLKPEQVQCRYPILNAYYLPGAGRPSPYPTISPVNCFRLLFNRYFGGHYPLLPDRSYYSGYNRPYKFLDVTDVANSTKAGTGALR